MQQVFHSVNRIIFVSSNGSARFIKFKIQMLPSFPGANKEKVISLPVRPIYCSHVAKEKILCEKNGNEDDGTGIKGFHMSSKQCRTRARTRAPTCPISVIVNR